MKDFTQLTSRLALIILSSAVGACVVVPKKVASYDEKCMVSTQKIELTMEQAETFSELNCTNDDCDMEIFGEIASSALLTTTSAVVSGSIALVGNTLYWIESQGECPNKIQQKEDSLKTQPENTEERYLIKEEIITAKS